MNLINQLQESAEKDDVQAVLRKAKRLASKLNISDIVDWLNFELDGYKNGAIVPEYRSVQSSVYYQTNGPIPTGYGRLSDGVFRLPYSGFTPLLKLYEPIAAIENMIKDSKSNEDMYMTLRRGDEFESRIRSSLRPHPHSDSITLLLQYNRAQIETIPDQIKNKVLDWALSLERAGITGEGMSFSEKEKQIAHNIVFNITGSNIEQLNNLGTNNKGQ